MRNRMKKQKVLGPAPRIGGFTLLELLVVIGIIALLLAFATVSYSSAQKRTRDAKRREDLKSMQNALEQYYSAGGYVYPDVCSDSSLYLQSSWPTDPGTTSYTDVNADSCTTTTYCVCATLEAVGTGNSTDISCNWGTGGGADYYCVANLQ
jgi:prepilin-type N-terminal cleavage/methylation domain-containing protein